MEQDVRKILIDLQEEVENIVKRVESIVEETPGTEFDLILEYAQQLLDEIESNLP